MEWLLLRASSLKIKSRMLVPVLWSRLLMQPMMWPAMVSFCYTPTYMYQYLIIGCFLKYSMVGRNFFANGQCTMHNCITHQITKWKWGLLGIAGTTCATILTRAIFTEGCKSVAAGMNAMDLRRGISMAVDSVVTNLKSRARMISTSEEIAQVCSYFWSGLSGLVSWTDSSMSFTWLYIEEP